MNWKKTLTIVGLVGGVTVGLAVLGLDLLGVVSLGNATAKMVLALAVGVSAVIGLVGIFKK